MLRSHYPDSAEMSDSFKLLDQCKLKVKQNNQKTLKHLQNTIYVINYSTDITKRTKELQVWQSHWSQYDTRHPVRLYEVSGEF